MSDYDEIYKMAFEAGYFYGRYDETVGKEYDDRTPLTKQREDGINTNGNEDGGRYNRILYEGDDE